MDEFWSTVSAERRALADDLAALTEDQWGSESWCVGWSVRDVVAHLIATASLNPGSFLLGFLTSGFSFEKFAAKQIARHVGDSPADTLARFRAVERSTSAPPGPRTSWLGEVLVHAEDIRRPLGLTRAYPLPALVQVADFYQGSNTLIGTKDRIAGLRLRATDTEWTHGDGELVEGPMGSMLMAMTGRAPACADLTGPGVETLRARGGGGAS